MSKPLPFQWLAGADTPNSLAQQAQANFDALAQEKADSLDGFVRAANGITVSGARQMTFGTSVVTITNGVSASVNATHGLGAAPSFIVATPHVTGDGRDDYIALTSTRNASTFLLQVRGSESAAFPLANPTNVTVDWFALI